MVSQDYSIKLRIYFQQFVVLSDDDWMLLEPYLEEKVINKNELFAENGKTAKWIGFVIEGSLRHFYIKDTEERTTYFYFENHLVAAYLSCITNQPSLLSIEALTPVKMIVFPYQQLQSMFDQSKAWEKFGRLIAEYLVIGLEERMVDLLLLSPEERYGKLLKGNKNKIIQRIPQQYIANYLGITPVSLSRIRNRFLKK